MFCFSGRRERLFETVPAEQLACERLSRFHSQWVRGVKSSETFLQIWATNVLLIYGSLLIYGGVMMAFKDIFTKVMVCHEHFPVLFSRSQHHDYFLVAREQKFYIY